MNHMLSVEEFFAVECLFCVMRHIINGESFEIMHG